MQMLGKGNPILDLLLFELLEQEYVVQYHLVGCQVFLTQKISSCLGPLIVKKL